MKSETGLEFENRNTSFVERVLKRNVNGFGPRKSFALEELSRLSTRTCCFIELTRQEAVLSDAEGGFLGANMGDKVTVLEETPGDDKACCAIWF